MVYSVNNTFFTKTKGYCNVPVKDSRLSTQTERKTASVPFNFRSYINFTGNAPEVKKASIITSTANDIELSKTKNGGYIVEPETQTELIYGKDATAFLNKTNKFSCDTQITFPIKAEGTLLIDGKEVSIKENSTVIINKGTEAKVNVKKGYPQILMSQSDYAWYNKHSNSDQQPENLKNKFKELIYHNSHTYNGDFKPNMISPNNQEKSSQIINKLRDNGFITDERNGYYRFKNYTVWNYQKEQLAKKGFNEEELNAIEPAYKQIRQSKLEAKLTLKGRADSMSPDTVKKLKDNGILYNNKTHREYIFWKTNFEGESHLREVLNNSGIYDEEQNSVVNAWTKDNKIGYDLTGLKFINDNVAVYCLDDKVNNWTMEKSCWVTNSTELGSKKSAPSVGTSIVQANQKEPTPMSKLRKGECLHTHPGFADKSQTEIYMITSGSAALTVVRDGVPKIKVLREGELAVIPPNTPHCVNSVMGEYEQVVSQIPSAFQYGFGFKQNYDLPYGYTHEALEEQAKKELMLA